MSSIPATVAVLSRVFLKEAISARVWAAIACGVLGIGLLSLTQTPGTGNALDLPGGDSSRQWLGNLLIFGAVLCEGRSEEHTSELQSLMRISYAVFCLKK